jgi:S1 RNA binding domain
MKITLTQSENGCLLRCRILIRIETNDICTQIRSSSVFDPYGELYVWLGQTKDFQFPAKMIIDEEGYGVELITEHAGEDLVEFRIEPWLSNEKTTQLKIILDRREFIQAFYDGVITFIKNEYEYTKWTYMDSLRNQPWGRLVEKTTTHNPQWKERLALYGDVCGRVSETEGAIVWNKLTQEQQQLMMFHDDLFTTVQLAKNSFTTEAYTLVGLYRSLLIDLVLGELEPSWYAERRAELENTHQFVKKTHYQKPNKRKQLYMEARLKTLKMGQIIDGRVSKVKHYGLFVDIGGCYALLHTDNISQASVENLEEIFHRSLGSCSNYFPGCRKRECFALN